MTQIGEPQDNDVDELEGVTVLTNNNETFISHFVDAGVHFTTVRNTKPKHTCRRCNKSFESNNKLHEHLGKCSKKARVAGPAKIKIIQAKPNTQNKVIPSTVTPSGTGIDFKKWSYCTIQASLTENGTIDSICPDSGNVITLVD